MINVQNNGVNSAATYQQANRKRQVGSFMAGVAVGTGVTALCGSLAKTKPATLNSVSSVASDFINNAKNMGGKAWAGLKDVGGKAWAGLKDVGAKAWALLKEYGAKAWTGLKKVGQCVWNGAKKAEGKIKDVFKNIKPGNTNLCKAGKAGLIAAGVALAVAGVVALVKHSKAKKAEKANAA